ncbi:hypothetical protein [Nocardioides stalactiti]|uniref:hypothetical protein n=1 Tax=Nocardioides stalactiti TaxID=2755356 RepID=UPI0015FF9D4E|nr:hypothetical protein [Nocardioides stalactiti]
MPDSFSLDSRAVLGLLAKAHQVFAGDDVTLAFPLRSPVAFDAAELSAALGPTPDGPAHALLAEFSMMMNWVPEGPVWPPSEPRQLDDVVRSVLADGIWAAGDRTPEEEERFAAAQQLVSMTNPVMSAYLALKDAWIRSREQSRNNQGDPVAVEAERQAEAALVAYPQRPDIERALDDLVALDARAPYRTRQQMQTQIDAGIGSFDNPSVGRFSPVRPLPKEVIEAENWDRVSLDEVELAALAAAAPPELLAHLTVPDEEDATVSISFEYASAQLHRQWLDERLFRLQCWKFSDEQRRLSDGGDPPSGECPRYVRAIVLARNVTITKKAPPVASPAEPPPEPTPETPSEPSSGQSSMDLLLPRVARFELLRDLRPIPDLGPVVDPAPEPVPETVATEPSTEPSTEALVAPMRIAGLSRISRLGLRGSDLVAQPEPIVPVTLVRAPELTDLVVEEARRAPDFQLVFQPRLPVIVAPPDPAPDPGLVVETTPPGRLILLALICKSVGRSPDPNPYFRWDS